MKVGKDNNEMSKSDQCKLIDSMRNADGVNVHQMLVLWPDHHP
jgi:hypothetical protein